MSPLDGCGGKAYGRRVGGRAVFLAVAATAIVAGTVAGEAHAAAPAEPALQIVGGTKEPRTVALKTTKAGEATSGPLTVLVRNNTSASGELSVTFVESSGRAELTPKSAKIDARGVTALHLNFASNAEDSKIPATLAGAVVVRFAGAQAVAPAVLQVKAGAAPAAAFEQKTAKFTVTRILGPIPRLADELLINTKHPVTGPLNGKADVGLRDAGGLTKDPVTEALLGADNGRVLRARLHPPDGNGNGLWRSMIDVTNVARTGEYTGTMRLDPSDLTSSGTDLTVRVQDLIVFPILAVLLGAALGQGGRKSYELWRKRSLLTKRLEEAADSYDKAYPKGAPRGATLDERLGEPGSDAAARRWACDDQAEDALDLTEVYCHVKDAKGVAQLAKAAKAVDALVADIERWTALQTALKALRRAIKVMPDLDELERAPSFGAAPDDPQAARRESEQLLTRPADLDDQSRVSDYTAHVKRQTEVAGFFAAAWAQYEGLRKRFEKHRQADNADARDALDELDPRKIYSASAEEYERSEKQTSRLLADLLNSARELAWHRRHLKRTQRDADERDAMHSEDGGVSDAVVGMRFLAELPDMKEPPVPIRQVGPARRALVMGLRETGEEPPPPRPPDPKAIEADIRKWDRTTFWAIATITVLGYLLPLYVGKSWGDWDDYTTAFAAGFAGTAVIPWDLLPGFRTESTADQPTKSESKAVA